MIIKCGHCQQGHGTVAEVKQCAEISPPYLPSQQDFADAGDSMSEGLDRVRLLLKTREVESRYAQHMRVWVDSSPSNITHFGIKTAIARLESCPEKRSGGPVVRDGIYRTPDGEIWKVQWNRASGTGRNLYAKHWRGGGYRYEPGGLKAIRDTDRMTREAAAALGTDVDSPLYGRCVNCSRDLTDEESIERGMGPDCWGKKDYWD